MITIPADSDTAKLAHRISEICKRDGLQIRKSRTTPSNDGVRCEFVLAAAMLETMAPAPASPPETPAFINTAMRDAGEKALLDQWELMLDAHMRSTAGEVVEQVYVVMHAKRPVEEIEITHAMLVAGTSAVLNLTGAGWAAHEMAEAVFKAMIAARTQTPPSATPVAKKPSHSCVRDGHRWLMTGDALGGKVSRYECKTCGAQTERRDGECVPGEHKWGNENGLIRCLKCGMEPR